MDGTQILDLPMQDNDAGAATIRDYLKALLAKLWEEEEGFSGKRPFGNSGWQGEVHFALVKAGAVDGTIDEYEGNADLNDVDEVAADRAIKAAIAALA